MKNKLHQFLLTYMQTTQFYIKQTSDDIRIYNKHSKYM